MKTKLLSFLTILTICIGVHAQNVTIPDANFKAYLVGNSAINTNGDTEIQISEATAFSGTINCTFLSISDLTGIEAFENITILRCADNQITCVNISNNIALVTLNLQNNQLTNLDVTANTQLQVLRVANNSISNLNISSNISLIALEVNGNQLNNINISTNTSLIHLYLNNNNISSLDISSHTALNYLDVSNNNLSSLNVANGNNANFYDASNGGGSGNPAMDARQNPNLSCIQIDASFTPPNSPASFRWEKDASASYNTNCAALNVDDFEFNKNRISVYPNPVNSILNIKMNSNLKKATIFSILGTEILKTTLKGINTDQLKKGVYLIQIEDNTGNISTKRFIKS